MSKISFLALALSLISTLCFAEKQLELTVDTQEQLAMLVSENDYVVLVEINEGKFTGACMVHNKVKVMANLKGKLKTSTLFSSINPDENALPTAIEPPKNPLPILTPGTYIAIVEGHEIIHSFPGIKVPFLGRVGKPKPSFNYFIQCNGMAHCAWTLYSAEANYLRKLAKKNGQHSDD